VRTSASFGFNTFSPANKTGPMTEKYKMLITIITTCSAPSKELKLIINSNIEPNINTILRISINMPFIELGTISSVINFSLFIFDISSLFDIS